MLRKVATVLFRLLPRLFHLQELKKLEELKELGKLKKLEPILLRMCLRKYRLSIPVPKGDSSL